MKKDDIQSPKPLRFRSWITPELIAETIKVWQPHYESALTEEDATEILDNTGKLLEVLKQI
jgi:hypothetical protein